jgi:flagellar FliJ protein
MKKFNFSLQAVLEHRAKEEELAQQELFKALRVVDLLKEEEAAMREDERRLILDLEQMRKGKMSVEHYSGSILFHSQLLQSIAYKQDELMKATIQANQTRETLKLKSQERKVLEKLKEKRYKEWQKLIAREESKQLDEIATIRYERGIDKG